MPETERSQELAAQIASYIACSGAALNLGTTAIKPEHRHPFHWPPHPISYGYRVRPEDWKPAGSFNSHGESFEIEVAETDFGFIGRSIELWHEAKGATREEMLRRLKEGAQPLLKRQAMIAKTLGLPGRFNGSIRDLDDLAQLKLFFCPNRDVAHEAHSEIESKVGSRGIYGRALIAILNDRTHPYRCSAQWCVLDLFEDLDRVCPSTEEQEAAVQAMKNLIWDAECDFARTTFKAGVVLGGHLPGEVGGPVLMQCLDSPSKFGRRSAIHGLFHVVEWQPETRSTIVAALRRHASHEPEPLLADFAKSLAKDIENGAMDHINEPSFEDEL